MFFFGKKKRQQEAAVTVEGSRHLDIAAESMQLIERTLNPATFFGRCSDIAFSEEQITGQSSEFLADEQLQTELQIAFIDRVLAAGRIHILEAELPKYAHCLTAEAADYWTKTVGDFL